MTTRYIPSSKALSLCLSAISVLAIALAIDGQQPSRDQWGAPAVVVSKSTSEWVIKGRKNTVTLNSTDLALTVNAGTETWRMAASSAKDMTVRASGKDFDLRLADAGQITIVSYDTGFKTGVKISLGQWKYLGKVIDLGLTLTVCLQGAGEELVFEIAADERNATLRQLDWPTALDAAAVDYTVLSN